MTTTREFPTLTLCLPTEDRRRAHAFYGAGLGLATPGELAEDGVPEPLRVSLNAGCQLMLIPVGGFGWVTHGAEVAGRGTSECLLALPVATPAEVDSLVARARAAGATVVDEPQDRPWGYTGTFADPDGHLWEVSVGD